MSEIKGQLLGLVLVLGVFAIVGGVLYSFFQNTSKKIGEKVDSAISSKYAVVDYVI